MKKARVLWAAVVFLVVSAVLCVGVFAEEGHVGILDSGACGDNLKWTLYEDGLLDISGTGKMVDYPSIYNSTPWSSYRSRITALSLNEGITTIGDVAFNGLTNIKGDLIIPDSVVSIGENVFTGCTFDGSLILGDSVTSIGDNAFANCRRLMGDLIVPDSVSELGRAAFFRCYGFDGNLIIGNGIVAIPALAFGECTGLIGELFIGKNVTTIGEDAFLCCRGLKGNLDIPEKVTEIGANAFHSCSGFTGSLTIPDSVTKIGVSAFSGCSGFTDAHFLGDAPTSFGCDNYGKAYEDSVFSGCAYDFTVRYFCDKSGWTTPEWNGYSAKPVHSCETHHEAVAPTCTEPGNTEYYICEKCGKYCTDEMGEEEIAAEDIILPALGHTLSHIPEQAPSAGEDGHIEHWVCSVCEKLFSDAEGQHEVSAEDTVLPARVSVPGDMNGDGVLDSDDAIYLLRHTLNPARYPISLPGNVNGDDAVDSDDAIYLLRHTLNPARYPLH